MVEIKQEVLKENRTKHRVSLVVEISCRSKNTFEFGMTENISETGLLIDLPHTLPLHSEIEVRFALPMHSRVAMIHAKGKVAWMRPGENMGIQFLDLKEEFREAIAKFVQQTES